MFADLLLILVGVAHILLGVSGCNTSQDSINIRCESIDCVQSHFWGVSIDAQIKILLRSGHSLLISAVNTELMR